MRESAKRRKERLKRRKKILFMSYIVCGTFVILTAVVLVWVSIFHKKPADIPDYLKNQDLHGLEIESIIEDGAEVHIAAHYPKTTNTSVNDTIRQYINKRVSDFKSQIVASDGDEKPELSVLFDVFRYSEDIVGFKFSSYANYPWMAHGESEVETMTFNLKTAQKYALGDIFSVDEATYLGLLSSKTLKGLGSEKVYEDKGEKEQLVEGTKPTKDNFNKFAIDKSKLTIFFDRYQIGSGAVSVDSFAIPLSELKSIINTSVLGEPIEDSAASNGEEKPSESKPEAVAPKPDVPDGLKKKKLIAITFDDGPHGEFTPRLLDILKRENVKATFFVLGSRVGYYSKILKRTAKEGHQIGNHTYNHRDLTSLSKKNVVKEIEDSANAIKKVIGYSPSTMRPPYGAWDDVVRAKAGTPVILWSIDPRDWDVKNTNAVYRAVVDKAYDGAIILLHDIYGTSVDAAEKIIVKLKKDGYTFVTVDQLIAARSKAKNGKIYTSLGR